MLTHAKACIHCARLCASRWQRSVCTGGIRLVVGGPPTPNPYRDTYETRGYAFMLTAAVFAASAFVSLWKGSRRVGLTRPPVHERRHGTP